MKPITKENKTKKQLLTFSSLLIMLFFAYCPVEGAYCGIIGEKDTTIILFNGSVNTLQKDMCNNNAFSMEDRSCSFEQSTFYNTDFVEREKQNEQSDIPQDFASIDNKSIICISEGNNIIVDKNRFVVLE